MPSSHGRMISAVSGRTTIRPSHVSVQPMASGKPGRMLGCTHRVRGFGGDARPTAVIADLSLVDAVEDAAIGEVGRLGFLPAAELPVDGHQGDILELRAVLRKELRIPRPEVMLADQVLGPRAVEEPQVLFGRRAGLVA